MRTLAYWLAIAFVFTVPWEAAIQVAEIGRASRAVGLLAGLIWVMSVIARGRLRQPDTFQKLLFVFLVWSGLTLYWSIDVGATTSGFLTYVQLFALVLMFWDLFDSRRAIETALQSYVLGAYVSAGSIIVNYVTAPEARFPEYERINALGFQTDGIALIVAIAGPAAWYLATGPSAAQRRTLLRAADLAYLPVGLLALVMTGTRGATLASLPTVVLVVWFLRRASGATRAMALGAIAAAVVLVIAVAPRGPLARIATSATTSQLGEEGGALESSGRWSIWAATSRAFLERPIAGVGLDATRTAIAPEIGQQTIYKKAEKEAHNTYLSVLAETGIVGFVLFASMALSVVTRVRRFVGWEAWYWYTQLAVLAIGAMSLSLEDSKSVWIFLSLAVSAAAVETQWAFLEAQRSSSGRAVRLGTVGQPYPQG